MKVESAVFETVNNKMDNGFLFYLLASVKQITCLTINKTQQLLLSNVNKNIGHSWKGNNCNKRALAGDHIPFVCTFTFEGFQLFYRIFCF